MLPSAFIDPNLDSKLIKVLDDLNFKLCQSPAEADLVICNPEFVDSNLKAPLLALNIDTLASLEDLAQFNNYFPIWFSLKKNNLKDSLSQIEKSSSKKLGSLEFIEQRTLELQDKKNLKEQELALANTQLKENIQEIRSLISLIKESEMVLDFQSLLKVIARDLKASLISDYAVLIYQDDTKTEVYTSLHSDPWPTSKFNLSSYHGSSLFLKDPGFASLLSELQINDRLCTLVPLYNTHNISVILIASSQISQLDDVEPILNRQAILQDQTSRIIANYAVEESIKLWQKVLLHFPSPIGVLNSKFDVLLQNPHYTQDLHLEVKNQLSQVGSSLEFAFNNHIYSLEKKSFKTGDQSLYLISLQDLTEERDHLAKFAWNEKMRLLSRLSEKIAHDLLNPIGGIVSMCQLLINGSHLSNQVKTDIKEIEAAGQRAIGIIESLRSFSSDSSVGLSPHDLYELLGSSLVFAKSLTRHISVKNFVEKNLPKIQVHPELFKQIILNLIQNSVQAMGDRGSIEIKSRLPNPDTLQLILHDSGPGIDPRDQDRIFEPIFSTKEIGHGTGLGLSFVKSTLNRWGADVYLDKTVTDGACFVIELPVAK